MERIELVVHWSSGKFGSFELDEQLTVAECIEQIALQLLARDEMVLHDQHGDTVDYALYRRGPTGYEWLQPRRMLSNLKLPPRASLYLANTHAPWWDTLTCHVELIQGLEIDVPRKGLLLNRPYLLKHLPAPVIERELQRIKREGDSPLQAVSRDKHCEIFFNGDAWAIRSYKSTYVDNDRLYNEQLQPLITGRAVRVILGERGWPIAIHVGRQAP
jgi:hypothetical protein